MLYRLSFLLILVGESLFWQHRFFDGQTWVNDFLVGLSALFLWGLIFNFRRLIVGICLVLWFLLNIAIIAHHQYLNQPLSPLVMITQFREGLTAGSNAPGMFNSLNQLINLLFLVLNLGLLIRFSPFAKRYVVLIFLIPLILLLGAVHYHITGIYRPFFYSMFSEITKDLGYILGWSYDLSNLWDIKRQKQVMENNIMEPENSIRRREMSADLRQTLAENNPRLAQVIFDQPPVKNVFLIQFESWDYETLHMSVNGRKVMPVLSSLPAVEVKIRPRAHKSSAHTDFMILNGLSDYEKMVLIEYSILDPDKYAHLARPLPLLLKEQGFLSDFYHGHQGNFYGRKSLVTRMGFERVYFQEDLEIKTKSGPWGFADLDVVDYMLNNYRRTEHEKNFTFWITVSSHNDYDIGLQERNIYPNPETEKEKYLNSINYVDKALGKLISKAPKDSLFIIYSDHQSGLLPDESTILYIYNKKFPQTAAGEISINDLSVAVYNTLKADN